MAFSLASSYARAYNASVGSIFQTSADHPYGSYRVIWNRKRDAPSSRQMRKNRIRKSSP
jgi:hypothetical protein